MQELTLKVSKRKPQRRVDGVRGIVYGKKQPSEPILADELTLERLYQVAGNNRLFDLFIGENKDPLKVLFQDVQLHPVSHHIIHFDLNAVSLKEKIRAEVPVHFLGDAPAVVTHSGIMTTITDMIEVEAEPLKLPERYEVDISGLAEINDHITVADLRKVEDVEILTEPEIIIVKIDPIVEEEESEEEEAIEEAKEAAEGEVVEGEAVEGEPTPEGETEAPAAEADQTEKER